MATEPITGWPYPASADAPNGAAQIQSLVYAANGSSGRATPVLRAVDQADRDARFGGTLTPAGVIVTCAASGVAWLKVATTGTASTDWSVMYQADDTGWISAATAGFTAASGFSGLAGNVRRKNGVVQLSLTLTSTNAIGTGNVANVTIVNVPAGWQVSGGNQGIAGAGSTGGGWSGYQQNAAIVLASTVSGIAAGSQFSVLAMYLAG